MASEEALFGLQPGDKPTFVAEVGMDISNGFKALSGYRSVVGSGGEGDRSPSAPRPEASVQLDDLDGGKGSGGSVPSQTQL